jgi:GNAT superfamily N-acetyltransferase
MRAKEFIVEYREDYEGITIEMKKHNHQLVVKALDDWGNNELGHVVFNIGDGKELDPQDLEVEEKYQGQGIARVMYDYVKSKGYEIHRSWDQTDAGAGFWNKHRGEDVRVWEDVPQPGQSSGAPTQFAPGTKIQNRQMTAKQIILSIPGVPYYNNVVDDWDAKDFSWGVTKKVIEYAQYLKQHPESLSKLPPIQVVNGEFKDGAHRVSAIWLLQQRMDPHNPLWKNAKLNVQFANKKVLESSNELVSASQIYATVQKIHRALNDFSEGDLGDRIYWFDDYKLVNLPISKLNLDEHWVDEDYVEDYMNHIADSKHTMPPIVFDPIAGSIIDGTHRANAYARLGNKTIPAYVGNTKSQYYGQRDSD